MCSGVSHKEFVRLIRACVSLWDRFRAREASASLDQIETKFELMRSDIGSESIADPEQPAGAESSEFKAIGDSFADAMELLARELPVMLDPTVGWDEAYVMGELGQMARGRGEPLMEATRYLTDGQRWTVADLLRRTLRKEQVDLLIKEQRRLEREDADVESQPLPEPAGRDTMPTVVQDRWGAQLNNEDEPAKVTEGQAAFRLLNIYTNGVADEQFVKASNVLIDDTLTINERLSKIDNLLPIPPTASAEKLGKAAGRHQDGSPKNNVVYRESQRTKRREDCIAARSAPST